MRCTILVSTESRSCAHLASRALRLVALALLVACGSPTTTTPPAGANVLALVSGDGQHARLTRELPQPIIVIARNSAGSAVSGVGIAFTTSNGSLSTSSATSDAAGQASVRWTLGATAGAQTLTARLASGTGTPLTINAMADPAIIVSLQALDGDRQQAVVGTTLGVAPRVIVRDAQGVLASGLGVRFTVTAGGGAVGSTAATTDANGMASAGAWTLGSAAGDNTLSVTPSDGDVVASTPLAFSAVGVAAGGVTSSPMRSYILNSSGATTVQDSVTGQAFRFRNGAHGTLDVARVTGGAAAPIDGAIRFRATFSGPEMLEVVMVRPPGGEAEAYVFGDNFSAATVGPRISRWWGTARVQEVGDSVFFSLQPGPDPGPASSPSHPESIFNFHGFARSAVTNFLVNPAPPVVRAYAVVALPPVVTTAYYAYRHAVQQTIDWWLANLPSADATRTSTAIAAHQPYAVFVSVVDSSAYDYTIWTLWRPTFYFNTSVPTEREPSSRHEAGHYVAHMMLGDAAYQALTNNGPVQDNHQIGEVARGVRQSLSEEYAYASQFFMNGDLDGYDLRSLRSYNNVPDLFQHKTPNAVDFPSLEGFGAAMLAALTRTGTDTLVYDISGSGSRTRSPALGISVTTLLGVLAKGPQNPNELRTLLVPLVSDEEVLNVLLEPIGWSYWGTGRVVDPAGQPVAGVTVRSVVKVNGIEYLTPASVATGSDGYFNLLRLYPGTSVLRLYKPNGSRVDSTDAREWTVSWQTATSTGQVFGNLVLMGMPSYNDITVSLSGFASPNTLGTSTCKPNFGLLNSLNTSSTTSAFYPLSWSGNHFSASASSSYGGTAASGYPSTANESMSISGTVTIMHSDSVWVTLTGSQSLRIEELVPGPPATWQLAVQESITFSLGSLALASNGGNPATYRGTLHGTPAAITILSANPSYFNQSTITPTFLPQSCHSYSLNPANADIQVTLRIR